MVIGSPWYSLEGIHHFIFLWADYGCFLLRNLWMLFQRQRYGGLLLDV